MKDEKNYYLGTMHGYLKVAKVSLTSVIESNDDLKSQHYTLLTDDEVEKLNEALEVLNKAEKKD